MNRIKEIWKRLEINPPMVGGFSKIRFSETSPCDLYLGQKSPENLRVLAISVSPKNADDTDRLRNLKGLRIEKIINSQKEGYVFINLILSDNHFTDIFDVLIEDIIANVINLSAEKEIIRTFVNRIGQWQTLFDKFKQEGLTEEYQRGLYGELYFLKRALAQSVEHFKIVQGWVGSSSAVQDFQLGESAIEVKISSGNNHQKIHINNERQLDDSLVENLFLFHISVDVRASHGETLNEIVNGVRELLVTDPSAYALFNHKLVLTGYFDIHREIYSEIGYKIREANYYKVNGHFPRLRESDIPDGVGDIKYTINISDCSEFLIPEADIFKLIL